MHKALNITLVSEMRAVARYVIQLTETFAVLNNLNTVSFNPKDFAVIKLCSHLIKYLM